MRKPSIFVLLLSVILLLAWPSPSYADVSVDRAELSGGDLRVEGEAEPDAAILIDGVERGSADGDGEFRIEISGFSSPTCQITVDDGTGAVTANLTGCTPTATEPPPEPEPEPTPVTASSVALNPTSVPAGSASTLTVTLTAAAPAGGAQVSLLSGNTAVAAVPPSVTVTAGSTTGTATVSTFQVSTTSSAAISATYGGTTRTATLTVVPAASPDAPEPTPVTMSSLGINPDTVTGGGTATATVTLNAPAPTGGAEVSLVSTNTAVATVPASITVPQGFRATTVTISTSEVSSPSTATISATYGGVTRSDSLTVNPAPAGTVSLSTFTAPETMTAGDTAQGVVTLTGPAPSGGATVSLFSSNTGIVRVPPSVLVPAGDTSASFTVTAANASTASATVTAGYGGVQRSVTIRVTAAEAGQSLNALSISPTTITDTETAQAIVSFTSQVASDKVVALSSDNTSVATVPASVTVPAGAAGVTFTVTGQPVTATSTATITASFEGVQRTATITVSPTPASTAPVVTSVTFSPSTLEGGAAATGTVTLDGPATDGAVIDLVSSHPDLVQVQAELVFSVNSTSESFAVTTTSSASDVPVTITATARCCGAQGADSGVLDVTRTTAPPETDTVRITDIEWRRCIFSVEATGTNHDAILTVHLASSGSEVLELTNLGNGEWAGQRAFRPPGSNVPVDFVLRSNFGGTDTATAADRRAGACRGDL
ncbi:MAG TPA: hypothetical protein VFQ19_03805 [Nocardioidaceae bacterium]|nr:hypothetical protein [Nocardioidaceae bacterium]